MIGIGIDTGGTCTDAVVFDITERCILHPPNHRPHTTIWSRALEILWTNCQKNCCIRHLFLHCLPHWPTNACVENKGGRVFMIFIGVSEKVVRNTYRDYGFESLDDILFVEGNAKEHTEPGWDLFEMEIANVSLPMTASPSPR